MVVMNYVLMLHELKLDGGNELCFLCKVIHRLTIQLKLDGGNE